MFQLYITTTCAEGLVRFRNKGTLGLGQEKIMFCHHKHSWKISRRCHSKYLFMTPWRRLQNVPKVAKMSKVLVGWSGLERSLTRCHAPADPSASWQINEVMLITRRWNPSPPNLMSNPSLLDQCHTVWLLFNLYDWNLTVCRRLISTFFFSYTRRAPPELTLEG